MKYDAKQFETLVKCLNILNNYIDLQAMSETNLHYLVFKQFSNGQEHNRLIVVDGILKRKYNLVGDQLVKVEGEPVFNFSAEFELYPSGCNDTQIVTAVNKAIKQVFKITA